QAWIGSSGIARPRKLSAPRQKSGLLIPGRYRRRSGRGRRAGSLAERFHGDGDGGVLRAWGRRRRRGRKWWRRWWTRGAAPR
ncbi:unnamed protein product, partial [Ectocarpus sp. 13 AM-2016]